MHGNEPQRFSAATELRLKEAKALLAAGFPEGAYYLAGYAVECALKACIARKTQEFDFPEKKRVNDSHTHDLGKLLVLAGLSEDLQLGFTANARMEM
jgi:HEPN domain-containing protein